MMSEGQLDFILVGLLAVILMVKPAHLQSLEYDVNGQDSGVLRPTVDPPFTGSLLWHIHFPRDVDLEIMLNFVDMTSIDSGKQSLTVNATRGTGADEEQSTLLSDWSENITSVQENKKFCTEARAIYVELKWNSTSLNPARPFSLSYQQAKCTNQCVVEKQTENVTEIFSPIFENKLYPSLQNCTYSLNVTEGQLMKIDFEYFHLKTNAQNCLFGDSVALYDVTSGRRQVGLYCGVQPVFTVYAGHKVELVFKSDGIPSSGGFHLRVSSVTPAYDTAALTQAPFIVEVKGVSERVALADFPTEFLLEDEHERIYQWLIRGSIPYRLRIQWELAISRNCSGCSVSVICFDGPTEEFAQTRTTLETLAGENEDTDGLIGLDVGAEAVSEDAFASNGLLSSKAGNYTASGFITRVKVRARGDAAKIHFIMDITDFSIFSSERHPKCRLVLSVTSDESSNAMDSDLSDCSTGVIYRDIAFVANQPYLMKLTQSIRLLFHQFSTASNYNCERAGFAIIDNETTIGPFCGSSDEERYQLLTSEGYISSGDNLRLIFYQYVPSDAPGLIAFRLEAKIADCQGVLWDDVYDRSVHPRFGSKPVCLQSIGYPNHSKRDEKIINPAWFGTITFELLEQQPEVLNCKYLLLLKNEGGEKDIRNVSSADINKVMKIKQRLSDCMFDFIHFILKIDRFDGDQRIPSSSELPLYQSTTQTTEGLIQYWDSSSIDDDFWGFSGPGHGFSKETVFVKDIYMIDDRSSNGLECTQDESRLQYEVLIYASTIEGDQCTVIEEFVSPSGCTSLSSNDKTLHRVYASYCTNADNIGNTNEVTFKTIGPQFRVTHGSFSTLFMRYKLVKTPRNLLLKPNPRCSCPTGYVQYKCNCYYHSSQMTKLLPPSLVLTRNSAKVLCEVANGQLTSVVDAEEMNAIWEMLWGQWWAGMVNERGQLDWIIIGIKGNQLRLGEPRKVGNVWQDGNPFVYSEWYRPENKNKIRHQIPFIRDDRDQPSLSGRCGAIYFYNLFENSNWFKIPCAAPVENGSFVCKQRAEFLEQPIQSGTTPNQTLDEANGQLCLGGWNYVQGVCLRLVSSQQGLNYTAAEQLCAKHSGSMAKGTGGMEDWYNVYMNVWLHRPQYGNVWLRKVNGIFLLPQMLSSVSERSPYQWKIDNMLNDPSRPTDSMTLKHVLCEMSPHPYTTTCGHHQFQCNDGTCIVIDRLCDGFHDCADKSDEITCDVVSAEEDESGPTILIVGKNNWYFNCDFNLKQSREMLGHASEEDVTSKTNLTERFNHELIPISRYCDYIHDCQNVGDVFCLFPICNPDTEYKCDNGQCINKSKRCNLINDCTDASDEKACTSRECLAQSSTFQCYSGDCVPSKARGDIFVDCPGAASEDEKSSGKPSPDNEHFPYNVQCRPDHPFSIQRSEACVYDRDEYGYVTGCRDLVHLRDCAKFQCPGMFKCSSGYCLPLILVCDGRNDCADGEDELDCSGVCPGSLKCSGRTERHCVEQSRVCDGFRDCKESGDDERFCDLPECHPSCQCVGYVVDCTNASLSSIPALSTSTRALMLAYNQLSQVNNSFDFLFVLASLDLSHNNISMILPGTFKHLFNLLELDLSQNIISSIDKGVFMGLILLFKLTLTGNPIQRISPWGFDGLYRLPTLHLENCNIEELRGDAFTGLISLTYLSIKNSSVYKVATNAFSRIHNLKELDISLNNIGMLSPLVFVNLTNLELLKTDHRSFCCAYFKTVNERNDDDDDDDDDDDGIQASRREQCYPQPDAYSSCSDLLKWNYLTAVVWVLGVLAFAGNAFVIIWRIVKERSNVINVLVLNLGISDFLMGVYLLMIAIADTFYRGRYAFYQTEWLNSGFCMTASILSMMSSEMSVYMLVVITVDRIITILFTFKITRLSLKQTWIIVAVGWVVSTFIAVLPYFGGDYFEQYQGSNAVCLSFNPTTGRTSGWEFGAFILTLNLVSFLFILISYIAIFRHYRKSKAALSKMSSSSSKSREIALARKLIFILTTDFICWIPIITIKYLALVDILFYDWVSPLLAVIILPINSSLNPFLYTVSALLDEWKARRNRSSQNSSSTLVTDADSQSLQRCVCGRPYPACPKDTSENLDATNKKPVTRKVSPFISENNSNGKTGTTSKNTGSLNTIERTNVSTTIQSETTSTGDSFYDNQAFDSLDTYL